MRERLLHVLDVKRRPIMCRLTSYFHWSTSILKYWFEVAANRVCLASWYFTWFYYLSDTLQTTVFIWACSLVQAKIYRKLWMPTIYRSLYDDRAAGFGLYLYYLLPAWYPIIYCVSISKMLSWIDVSVCLILKDLRTLINNDDRSFLSCSNLID